MPKRFVVTLNMLKDQRVPRPIRKTVFLNERGEGVVVGAISRNLRSVYVDVSRIHRAAGWHRITFLDLLLRTIDHEYAHVFDATRGRLSKRQREYVALAFEDAGRKVRKRTSKQQRKV